MPDTVQTAVVEEENVTLRFELAVADSVMGVTPSSWSPGPVKVMVCVASGVTVVTSVAVSFAVLISAELLTVAVFVMLAGAVAETLTVTVMAG